MPRAYGFGHCLRNGLSANTGVLIEFSQRIHHGRGVGLCTYAFGGMIYGDTNQYDGGASTDVRCG
jgi:hypothetical protein